ncbi:MAG: hypothetical protein BWY39_00043 [Spirochaetes bacterium ADurb.Bin269]|nr:MAG: hypothetical protein BWY39_00043 [Spirochaetes bacterium ADurb.Bin269]
MIGENLAVHRAEMLGRKPAVFLIRPVDTVFGLVAFKKLGVLAFVLKREFVVRHAVEARIPEPREHLPVGGVRDHLVVFGHCAYVENHRHRVNHRTQARKSGGELVRMFSVVTCKEGFFHRPFADAVPRAVELRDRHAVERKAEKLREGRLTGAEKARNPAGRQVRLLDERLVDVVEEVHHLLVDTADPPRRIEFPAGEHILADLARGRLRIYGMEVNNRRDVFFYVTGEYFFDRSHFVLLIACGMRFLYQ